MSTEIPVKLVPRAVEDLRGLGGLRGRLLGRALSDELRTPAPSLSVESLSQGSPWRALEIGDYRVVFRPDPGDSPGQPSAHIVARILDRDDYDELLRSGDITASLLADDPPIGSPGATPQSG